MAPLLVVAPLALLINALRRGPARGIRLASVGVTVVLLAVCLPPGAQRERQATMRSFAPIKRLESVKDLRHLDLNQTALGSQEQCRRHQAQPDCYSLPAERLLAEMQARRPGDTLRMIAESFAYLTGLCVHQYPREFTGADGFVALPLCGRPAQMNSQRTNFVPGTTQVPGYATVSAVNPNLEVPTSYLEDLSACVWFDRLFQGYHLLLPPLALLSIVGTLLAIRRCCYGLIAAALLVWANFAPFIYMYSPTDRYGLPFRIALLPVAVYALYLLVPKRRAAASDATCAVRAPAAQTAAACSTSR
jgi:hypothetical protein